MTSDRMSLPTTHITIQSHASIRHPRNPSSYHHIDAAHEYRTLQHFRPLPQPVASSRVHPPLLHPKPHRPYNTASCLLKGDSEIESLYFLHLPIKNPSPSLSPSLPLLIASTRPALIAPARPRPAPAPPHHNNLPYMIHPGISHHYPDIRPLPVSGSAESTPPSLTFSSLPNSVPETESCVASAPSTKEEVDGGGASPIRRCEGRELTLEENEGEGDRKKGVWGRLVKGVRRGLRKLSFARA